MAVIRTENPTDLVAVARALAEGGVKFVEITMTVPGAGDHPRRGRPIEGHGGLHRRRHGLGRPDRQGGHYRRGQVHRRTDCDPETVRLFNTYGVAVMPARCAQRSPACLEMRRGRGKTVSRRHGRPGLRQDHQGAAAPGRDPAYQGNRSRHRKLLYQGGCHRGGHGLVPGEQGAIAAKDYSQITNNARRFAQIVRDAKCTPGGQVK